MVEVLEIGETGARCKTMYKSEITVRWNIGIPQPVPQVGEVWIVDKMAQGSWIFVSKVLSAGYNLMRYSMVLDMADCVGRERAVIDDIANSGVSEVYLVVASMGRVYWASKYAKRYKLYVSEDEFGNPVDLVRQVVDRCAYKGLAVTFVIDCELWYDTLNPERGHGEFQQVGADERLLSGGWSALREFEWGEVDDDTWRNVMDMSVGSGEQEPLARHRMTMTFGHAEEPMSRFVAELYDSYSDSVRGVCFSNWKFDGAYADVSDYMRVGYEKEFGRDLVSDMTSGYKGDEWWRRRMDICEFFASVQRDFLASMKDSAPNWAFSAIVSDARLCLQSKEVGRYPTWLDDDFATYGWSMVGCKINYTRSSDPDDEMRSFEFDVSCLNRFAEGSSPLFVIDIAGGDNYSEMLNMLAKYDATNVLLSDYSEWRMLGDKHMIDLKNAMNSYSVTKRGTLDSIGFYLSSDSADISYNDESAVNRFHKAAQECAAAIINKLPHKLRILYDSDIENLGAIDGVSTIVLFNSTNMSDKAIDAVNDFLGNGSRSVVFIGRCGMRDAVSVERRKFLPFLDIFGESSYGFMVYCGNVRVAAGFFDIVDNVYEMVNDAIGVNPVFMGGALPTMIEAAAYTRSSQGSLSSVPFPIMHRGRSSMIAVDVLDNYVLLELVSEMVLYAVGRDA